jgi:hypothetical protein
MPVVQSDSGLELARKYRLKAIDCERQAKRATDLGTEQRWQELAAQWHAMADRAAKMLGGATRHESY